MTMNALFPSGCTLVFGGSGGIGQGVAMEFAREGTAVAIGYRSKRDVAEALVAQMRGLGVAASAHQVDVRDPDSVRSAVAEAAARNGPIHSMVWGAGPLVPQEYLGETRIEQYRNAFEVETFGFFHAVSALLPHFRQHGGGSIVHLGSAGHDWWPAKDGLSVVPKAANEALIKGIAKEEGRFGIRANSVLVGVIDAGMFHVLREQGQFSPEWEAETKKLLALKHWGSASDIGQAAVYFASARSRYVTGQVLSVSGGFGV